MVLHGTQQKDAETLGGIAIFHSVLKGPVIILTAKDELDEKINLLVAGADDYITKPFEIKEVVARVAVQLRHAVADVPSKSGKAGEKYPDHYGICKER